MGVHSDYLKVGQNRLFGVAGVGVRRPTISISCNDSRRSPRPPAPLQMLVSMQGRFNAGRLAVILVGLFTLAVGVVLTTIPWADYMILKDLKVKNGTVSYHYWQRPGVIRLTKVYIFNVTNPEEVLKGEKPKLNETGPYVYREDMQKVNVKFHDNGTMTFQHRKMLHFVPEMSRSMNEKICVPNIPLLALGAQSKHMPWAMQASLQVLVQGMSNFIYVTPGEFLFGYDDTLVTLANLANTVLNINWPAPKMMSLLQGRNGTLPEIHTMFTGDDISRLGEINRLNGLDHLPFWSEPPCNSIKASEGSLFPPREVTKEDVVAIYDKDMCRVLPLQWRKMVDKDGIEAGFYTPPDDTFSAATPNSTNKCYCPRGEQSCQFNGLQNVSPCHYDAPVFISYPHFLDADPYLLDSVEGLHPNRERHQTFFKIQPKLGVTMEALVRVQMNLKVEHAPYIYATHSFPEMIFPVMWLEEGVDKLTPEIHRWVYMATTGAHYVVPSIQFGFIGIGALILISVFVRTYKDVVFTRENLERGMEEIRTGSSLIVSAGHHRLHSVREQYALLRSISTNSSGPDLPAPSSAPAPAPAPTSAPDPDAEREPSDKEAVDYNETDELNPGHDPSVPVTTV